MTTGCRLAKRERDGARKRELVVEANKKSRYEQMLSRWKFHREFDDIPESHLQDDVVRIREKDEEKAAETQTGGGGGSNKQSNRG